MLRSQVQLGNEGEDGGWRVEDGQRREANPPLQTTAGRLPNADLPSPSLRRGGRVSKRISLTLRGFLVSIGASHGSRSVSNAQSCRAGLAADTTQRNLKAMEAGPDARDRTRSEGFARPAPILYEYFFLSPAEILDLWIHRAGLAARADRERRAKRSYQLQRDGADHAYFGKPRH